MSADLFVALLLLAAVVASFLVGPALAALGARVRQEQELAELHAAHIDVRRAVHEITSQAQAALLAEVARTWRRDP